MIIFWILRIIITISAQMGNSFMGVTPMNETMEILILFATVICIGLVIKRNLVGSLLYIVVHAVYYGADVTNKLSILANNEQLTLSQNTELMFSIIGIILPLIVLIDLLLDKNRKLNPSDKKTDWFYQNEQFDRKLDDRADKNNYRTM